MKQLGKILILDIETAPNIAYVWGMWKQNVGISQLTKRSHIMSYAAKWLDEEEMMYEENRKDNDKKIVKSLYKLLDQADVVVAHNAKKFDIPTILGRGVIHRLDPPSPFHIVDTLLVARSEFRFISNSLANIAKELKVAEKLKHKNYPGFELWLACLRGEEAAWKEMATYNIQDVITLEEVYLRLLPYMKHHPNIVRNTEEGVIRCPKCGSGNIVYRGYYYTKMGLCYRRFKCKSCGGWGRVRFAEKDINVNDGRNAV